MRGCAPTTQADFPATRDYFSLVGGVALLSTPLLATRQWRGFASLVSGMGAARSLRVAGPAGRDALNREVRRANRDIRRIGDSAPLVMLICALAMFWLMIAQQRRGVFGAIAPPGTDRDEWARVAYDHWWAGTAGDGLGFTLYFCAGSAGLYLITMQNLVTVRMLITLYRARGSYEFGADPLNADGYFGWGPIRTALTATYAELAMHGLGLVAVGATLPADGMSTTFAFAAVQWLLILLITFSFPPIFAWRKVSAFKEREIATLTVEGGSLAQAAATQVERFRIEDTYRQRIGAIRAVPTLPFRRPRDVAAYVISLVADVSAFVVVVLALL